MANRATATLGCVLLQKTCPLLALWSTIKQLIQYIHHPNNVFAFSVKQPWTDIFTVIRHIFQLFGGARSYLKENKTIKAEKEHFITFCEQTFLQQQGFVV